MSEDFQQHHKWETIVYDAEWKIIDRIDGFVMINPKNYDKYIPIEYHHVEITTQTYSIVRIDKPNSNE